MNDKLPLVFFKEGRLLDHGIKGAEYVMVLSCDIGATNDRLAALRKEIVYLTSERDALAAELRGKQSATSLESEALVGNDTGDLIIKSFSKRVEALLRLFDEGAVQPIMKEAAEVIRTLQDGHKVQFDATLEWHEHCQKLEAELFHLRGLVFKLQGILKPMRDQIISGNSLKLKEWDEALNTRSPSTEGRETDGKTAGKSSESSLKSESLVDVMTIEDRVKRLSDDVTSVRIPDIKALLADWKRLKAENDKLTYKQSLLKESESPQEEAPRQDYVMFLESTIRQVLMEAENAIGLATIVNQSDDEIFQYHRKKIHQAVIHIREFLARLPTNDTLRSNDASSIPKSLSASASVDAQHKSE